MRGSPCRRRRCSRCGRAQLRGLPVVAALVGMSTPGTRWEAQRMPGWFEQLTDMVTDACALQQRPNSCNVNRYDGGCQSIGWHADDDKLFDAMRSSAVIISLSLGASRTFMVRRKGYHHAAVALPSENGDLCVMGGLFQRYYQHAVPKEWRSKGVRYNFTWRYVVAHQAGCPHSVH